MFDPDRAAGAPHDPAEDVGDVVRAAVEMYAEWRMVDAALERGELDGFESEALAYEEGLLRCMEVLTAHTGVHVRPAAEGDPHGPRSGDGHTRPHSADDDDADDPPEATPCPECGGDRHFEMGREDPFCPACDL